jgi:hypothetical protein
MRKHVVYTPEGFVADAVRIALDGAGGATTSRGHSGYWLDADGSLHEDAITLVTVFEDGQLTRDRIIALLLQGGEKSVAYETDGVPYLTEEVTA